ncbi:MAG: efflux RND transporter permease subunit [Bacteroidetes bacterium]|nr:efflux RND transporter permease subunit [Bacteroidota bacterium]
MLTSIVRFSLKFKGIIIALACVLLAYGLYSLSNAKYDVFPEFAPAQVVIQTEAPGLSPEQVELLVTQPIENAVNGTVGISSMRSGSIQGISVITITFKSATNIYLDRQMVAERLSEIAGQLPAGVKAPVITPLTSSTSVVMAIGLTSDSLSLMGLRTVADWTIKPGLLAVPGVAKVVVFGGEVKQLQVQVRPDLLFKYGLSINDVIDAARRATGVEGAGFIDTPNQRLTIQTEGQSLTPAELGDAVVLQKNGADVLLKDVARVVDAPAPPIGAAQVMGKPSILLIISAQYGANTLDVTRKVDEALKELSPSLKSEGVVIHRNVFRAADFIETAVRHIRTSLLLGAILVVLVLLLFLFNLRTAAISLTVIPLSLLTAVIVLQSLGYSLNTMTLGGLAIAIGEVVDDAVIDVENILRRLRENKMSASPRPTFRVVLDASIEVRSAVVYATFAVTLVFVPILTMTGLAGRLFSPLGLAYIFSILASLLFALTITPAMCLFLIGRSHAVDAEPRFTIWLKKGYKGLLSAVERHFRAVIFGVLIFILLGVLLIPTLTGSFLPQFREGNYIIHMVEAPGTSLEETLSLGERVTRRLLQIPFVESVSQDAGRAQLSDDTHGTHQSELLVRLKPMSGSQARTAQNVIRKALTRFAGANFSMNSFLTERINETLSGYTSAVVVNIFGNNLDTLDDKAQDIASLLSRIRGATDVQLQSPPGTPQMVVRLEKSQLERWGFEPVDVMNAVQTAYQGDIVGQVYDGNRVFGVSVILDSKERHNPAEVGSLLLRNSNGVYVRLSQLADIYENSGRYIILHEGARRVQTITCNVKGRGVSSFVNEARKRIASAVPFPPGTYVTFSGTAQAQARSKRDLLTHSLFAAIGILLLLSVVMKNYRNLSLVLVNLPFALVGGVLAVFITGGEMSVGSLVGFVTLFGITLRNSIMLISHYEHLVETEGMSWSLEAAMRGASERLVPILMTATVTGLGLLPLALASGTAGREIEGPMAIVILGGLFTSTALNLLVLPTLALKFGKFKTV